jgi:hypothetical protein
VNATKFEIERLDKQIVDVKKIYFNNKKNEVIYEDMEGEREDEGQVYQEQYG